MALEKKEEWKTIADVEALPEGTRAELIDGEIFYNMAAPTVVHQEIVGFLTRKIGNYIESNNGKCKVYPAPFDVQLSANDKYNLVQPDVTVVCDRDKLSNGKRCIGAPDWVIEVVSPSTENNDYIRKLMKYSMQVFVNIGLLTQRMTELLSIILKWACRQEHLIHQRL